MGREARMKITVTNCHFEDCGTGFSLPANWDGKLDVSASQFVRVGKIVHTRDQGIEVPAAIIEEMLAVYKQSIQEGLKPDQAVTRVSSTSSVRQFFIDKGVDVANLVATVAGILQQVFGTGS